VIVEDEATIARRIARLTHEILGPDAGETVIALDLDEARAALATPARILILDLNLEGDDGFALLRESSSGACDTIVISAQRERAIEAFDYGVRDFVTKPFGRERLEQALFRVLSPTTRAEAPLRFLGVRRRGSLEFISIDEVRYVRGAGTYSELVLRNGATALHAKLLDQLESVLPPDFVRIHKSYIADLRHVRRLVVSEGSRYEVVLDDGTALPVGRTRARALRARLA
jgi:two-component system response regulator LytT